MEARWTKLTTAMALAGTFAFLPLIAVGQSSSGSTGATSSGTGSTATSPSSTNSGSTSDQSSMSGTSNSTSPGSTSSGSTIDQTAATGMSGSSSNSGTVNGTSTNVSSSGDTQQMLDGLVNVNVGNVTAVANVQDVLNNSQVQLLVQALNSNSSAQQNATQLTTQLQQQGKLQPDQQVIGMKDGKALVAPKSMIKGGGTSSTSASGGTASSANSGSSTSGPGASTVDKNTGPGASTSGAPGASGWAHEKNAARKVQHNADKTEQKSNRDTDKSDTTDKGTGASSSNNQ